VALGVLFIELQVLTDQSMGEAGRDADLIDGEVLEVQQDDPGKVLDIAVDRTLAVMGLALDLRELVAAEVEIKDLSLV